MAFRCSMTFHWLQWNHECMMIANDLSVMSMVCTFCGCDFPRLFAGISTRCYYCFWWFGDVRSLSNACRWVLDACSNGIAAEKRNPKSINNINVESVPNSTRINHNWALCVDTMHGCLKTFAFCGYISHMTGYSARIECSRLTSSCILSPQNYKQEFCVASNCFLRVVLYVCCFGMLLLLL